MALTDVEIRTSNPKDKQYKLSAGLGLYLIVAPNGGKWWRVRYRFGGKQKELSVGTYPDVSLKAATILRDDIRSQVRDGFDPAKERKSDKLHYALGESFGEIAIEWHKKHAPSWSKSYAERTLGRMNANLIRWMGEEHINDKINGAMNIA